MGVTIKTPAELDKMRVAGRLAAQVLEMITPFVEAGVSTDELNKRCHDYIVNEQGAIPAPLNYHGFPKSICTSVNHQVCHGIPGTKILKNGDCLNIDITVIKDGFHGVRPGRHLGDIGHAIQQYTEKARFSVVREYCGHGIGRGFHEEPQVLHYGQNGTGMQLSSGMTFTIEPMINAGKRHVKLLPDQWTVVTKDRKLSAQWEHTILVTETGHEVLTLRQEEIALRTAAI
jgi:methionyl aminopeptidase